MPTVKFNDRKFDSYTVVADNPGYGEIADVTHVTGDLYVVVIDYTESDSESRSPCSTFVDAFADIEKAEVLALAIKKAMADPYETEKKFKDHRERSAYGIEYTDDVGRLRRYSLASFFSWGSDFDEVGIVRAHPERLRSEGIFYR